ncbi:MAG: DNA-3-methyladenine glycosylase 2 family protein [Xanthomonadaceae bacterium]|nr:DNA-3-methyladenine glycosylase 2 family protein [Xanthomonadaceae bacterium]
MLPYTDELDAAIAALCAEDPPLAALIARVGDYRLELRDMHSPFLGLLRAIVYQQLSGKAAAAIHARLQALFPGSVPTPAGVLAMPEEKLRSVGLSRAKILAAKDLAAKTIAGLVPAPEALAGMDDEEIIARLTSVRGIGRWTAEMLLIFNLGRPDVLPVSDLGIRKGFMLTYGLAALPSPTEVRRHGARWAPYRTVASWYLWRANEVLP